MAVLNGRGCRNGLQGGKAWRQHGRSQGHILAAFQDERHRPSRTPPLLVAAWVACLPRSAVGGRGGALQCLAR